MNTIKFCGLKFTGLTKEILLHEEKKLKIIITVNAEFIVFAHENEQFKNIINQNYATFDGQIPFFFAKTKNKNIFFEKISGSDFIYDICEYAKKYYKKVFLLGGYPDSNTKAVEKLHSQYNIHIKGFSPEYKQYPFSKEHNQTILKEIADYQPDFLLVGFGARKQEFWINENKDFLNSIGVKWVIGVGGTFEFVAGNIKRAPKWVQQFGLEGVYRFFAEPKLFRLKRLMYSLKILRYLFD